MTITRCISIIMGITAWIAAMYAILHAEPFIPLRHLNHALCGPWTTTGCPAMHYWAGLRDRASSS